MSPPYLTTPAVNVLISVAYASIGKNGYFLLPLKEGEFYQLEEIFFP
jgi:hypothetical protein